MAGSIQRLADRPSPWRARYRAPDGRERSRTFARKVDAERWLRHELADQDRGRWVDPRAGSVTFGEWADSWLRGLDLKPKTRAVYESALRSRVLPAFGEVELRHISPAAVRTWLAAMLEDGVTARARQARQVLSQALSQAVADGLIARNPCEGVKAPVVRPRRQRFLTVKQLDRLSAACGERQPSAGVLVLFLGWSGLRWGEAVALRVGAVDGKRVRVREAATEVEGRLVFGSPKTHEERTVILPTLVSDQLTHLTEEREPDALVFTAPRGGPLRSSNFARDVWRPAVVASGVPSDLVVHDLRDTAASLAIASGASIKAVQRMLGHASAAMTLDIYGGLFEEDLEALAARMDDYGAAQRGHKTAEVVRLPRSGR